MVGKIVDDHDSIFCSPDFLAPFHTFERLESLFNDLLGYVKLIGHNNGGQGIGQIVFTRHGRLKSPI